MTNLLLKRFSNYFFINFFSQIISFALWLFFARILSPVEIGVYGLVFFVIEFFGVIGNLGLDSAITRFYYWKEKSELLFFNNAIVIFVFSIFFSLILFLILQTTIMFFIPGLRQILPGRILLFSFIIFFSTLYNFALAHYAALHKVISFGKASFIQTIIFLIFSILFLQLQASIDSIFFSLLISYFIASLMFLIWERKNIKPRLFSFKAIKLLFHYGIYIMLFSAFGVLAGYIGRIFLDRYAGLYSLGIFSFFLVIVLKINAIWSTFNRVWTPEIFLKISENSKNAFLKIQKILSFSTFLYLLFILAIILLEKIGIWNLFLKPIYLQNMHLFYILLLSTLFTGIYTICYPLYYYQNKTYFILIISVTVNILNVLLSFLLIKMFGQTGAALSFFTVSLLSMLIFIFSFKKSMHIPKKIIKWILTVSIFLVLSLILYLITQSVLLLMILITIMAIRIYYNQFSLNFFLKWTKKQMN